MEKLNKKLIVLMVILCLVTFPLPSQADDARERQRRENCQFAKNMGFLFASGGLIVSIIPGAQPIVAAYAVAALVAKGYEFVQQC